MTHAAFVSPSRRALNPVLSDDPMIESDGDAVDVFYTPAARRIARHMEFFIAGASGLLLVVAWIVRQASGPAPLFWLFTLLAFAIAGVPALETVWSKLRKLCIDIDLLMLLGAVLAAYVGSPFEGALLLFLFALSGALEEFALRRTQSAIIALRELSPKQATVIERGSTRRVPLRQVAIGAMILVRPGEKVPLDGTVEAGSSSLDESAITGESMPRDCRVGNTVLAGTQNLNGRLEVRVTKLAADTTLARIVHLVTEARHHPARAQRLIDRIGPGYSMAVIAAAILVSIANLALGLPAQEAVRRGIAVLIVASPCALIIATPVAYLAAIAAAARRGVLVKGGAHLEVVARAAAVAFDKTGTLTTGRVRLTDVDVRDGLAERDALRIAGGIEASSSHPLAEAVTRALRDRQLRPASIADYHSVPGEGAGARVEGKSVWIGRPETLDTRVPPDAYKDAAARAERFRNDGKTASALVIDGKVSFLAFADTVREHALACIEQLRRQGVKRLAMLTGDHEVVAAKVAKELRLDGYLAQLTPEDKLTAVQRLREQHGTVVVVGDGINDAPALVHADVGIAMGARGTDVAMGAADIVLMKERIDDIAWLHAHARRTARIVRQNLGLAIAVISVLSLFAAKGDVPLPLAVVGHEGSTVLVALNALRLLQSRPA
jgi:Cd2+/Zn2+-exporting ATPase